MTGTSMDGIDISLVKTNGINLIRLNKNYFYEYKKKTKDFLLSILNEDITFNLKRKEYLDRIVTQEHYNALKNLELIKECDLIGFHGQTIYHNPSDKISIQIGNPSLLSQMLKKDVVFDFRSNDIKYGGQGAPLAPIYHKFLIESMNLELPSCILNIGGVANLTIWDGVNLIGFDTGPGNALMDNYMKKISNKYFDENGIIASKGNPNKNSVNNFINQKFFKNLPPKSLDRNSFIDCYNKLLNKNLSNEDTMATLLEFTIESIFLGINLFPKKVNNIVVTGGGYRNNFLMKRLHEKLNVTVLKENELGFKLDFVESELIAFLSARSIYNLPFTFPSTTGTSKNLSGGKLYNYL